MAAKKLSRTWMVVIVIAGVLTIVKFRGELASMVSRIPGVGNWLVS